MLPLLLYVAHLRGEAGGCEAMLESMLLYPTLGVSCPFGYIHTQTATGGECGFVCVTTAVPPRDLVGRRGLVSGEYALHSERMGGATGLAASGVSTMETQRQGRWKNDALVMHVRATREEEDRVSRVLASIAVVGEIQPGQGTKWGGGRVRKQMNVGFGSGIPGRR